MVERLVPGAPAWKEFSAPHLARYLFAADYARNRRILDAGTGSGYGARLLQSTGATTVVGVDIDPETIQQAKTCFGSDNVEFLVDDCEQLSQVTGPFDLICSFENIEHLHHPERFLDAAGRLLAPDGGLLISTPDRVSTPPFVNGRPKNQFHIREWYADEFSSLLGCYFAEVQMYAQVETTALQSRTAAISALSQVLQWHNPIAAFFLRRRPLRSRYWQSWKQLADLAAPSISDYPIVSLPIATLFGAPAFHIAVCRKPRSQVE